jgi:hypothetical protein
MILPERIAICYFGDRESARAQSASIDRNSLPFEIEERFKYETNPHLLQTFSQMINEAIDDVESEFMIFVNPKTIISTDGIYHLVEKLCSGYCFASIFGMAYCGFTKELVRNIGMLDEDFLAGEYEDNDFLLRIRIFGAAVYWGQDWNRYAFYASSCPPNRGASLTYFWRKWRWRDGRVLDSRNRDKIRMISKRHSLSRPDIASSWKPYSDSWGEGGIWEMVSGLSIERSAESERVEECAMHVRINTSGGSFFIEMLSSSDTAISFFLVSASDRKPIHMQLVYSNTWVSIPFQGVAEMRLYHDGNLIYLNQINESPMNMDFRTHCHVI